MIQRFLLVMSLCLLASLGNAAEPLRVFIRAGEKTHGPADNGLHDHPTFLKKWVPLLNERGAVATGGMAFPTEEELAKTDVLVMFAQEGATVTLGQRPYFERFVARGGGVVVIHDAVCGHNPEWFKNIVGGAWEYGKAKWFEGDMNIYFTPPAREHPVTKGMSNFDLNDEIYWDLHLAPEAVPLAVCWTPEGKTAAQTKPELQIYATAPQMWSYEKDKHRAFVSLPGHRYSTFERPNYRALLLRAIAWTGYRQNVDELVTKEELASLAYPEDGPTAPEKSAAKFELHPDFDISLVAAEPLINKPMNVEWDAQGRMWIVETPEYPEGTKYGGLGTMGAILDGDKPKMMGVEKPGFTGTDKISILTDTNNDGLMDKKEVFATGLNLATSFVFHKNGVIVTQAPEILFLSDTDGDGKADKREVLYTGLGNGDTHAVINNARWGHDGWIYATHGYSAGTVKSADGSKNFGNIGSGVVRFKADGSSMEQYSSKGGNTWGLDVTNAGEILWTQPTSGDLLMQSLLSDSLLSKGKVGKTPSFNIILKSPKSEPLMAWKEQAYVQIDWVGSFTAAAGCAIYEGGAWPKEWYKSYFCTEPTINIVHHETLTPNGVTYDAKKVRPGEFLRSKDLWFRPVENRVGPDGALYVVDMYNQAAIHNDTRGPKHGPHNAAVRPDRDHYFGRIWRIQHKQAKKLDSVNLAKADAATLEKALENPNRQVQDTARRLLAESDNKTGAKSLAPVALNKLSPPELLIALSHLAESGAKPEQIKEVMDIFASLKDPWSQSAAVVVLNAAPVDTLKASLAAADVTAYLPLIEGLSEKIASTPADAEGALNALAEAPASADAIKVALLHKLSTSSVPGGKAALTKLLQSENTDVTLAAFVVATHSGVEESALANVTKALQTAVTTETTEPQRRINAAKALLGLSKSDPAILAAIGKMLASDMSADLKKELIAALGSQSDTVAAESILGLFTTLTPDVQTNAMAELMKKPERALAVIAALESKKIDYAVFGPGNYFQLKSHPDKAVSAKALAVEKTLRGAEAEAKDATIAKLTPEITKPGDAAKGKLMFEANCATCHQYGDKGVQVGPNLTGMGAHGAATLLVHVIDPNREVDPTFTAWIAQKKDGQFFMGVVTRENKKSIFLRNQAGETELNRADLTNLTNTGRSFMPEGFEALGTDVVRDILTYLTAADSRYRFAEFAGVATADSRGGLYESKEPSGGMLRFAKFGIQQAEGVPFNLLDPAKSAGGKNLIQLKGGPARSYSASLPGEVTLKVGYPATRVHFLGGVAGWGFPYGEEKEKVLQATIVYQGGKTEAFDFANGVEFADYIREVDVPGSKGIKNIVTGGQQIRYFNRELKGREPIEKIILKSPGGGVAPTIAAITLETADGHAAPANPVALAPEKKAAESAPAPAPPVAASANPNGLKVQLFGGGSSHDFEKWFNKADVAILEKAGYNAAYSGNPAEWGSTLDNAKVVIMSANQAIADLGLRKKIFDFADSGRGMILLHAALWQNWNDWSPWNQKIVGGASKSHDSLGEFEVVLTEAGKKHPVLKDVPEKFIIRDELYQFNPAVGDPVPEGTSAIEVLATATSKVTKKVHPILWTVQGNKNRIFACSLGHDGAAHDLPVFQKILTQAVEWVSGK